MPRRRRVSSLRKWIHSYLSNIYAGEMVLPRPHVVFCYSDSSPDDVLEKFRKYKYSRLPVVDKSSHRIVGYIFYKDFFDKYIGTLGKLDIKEVIREILFVPENMNGLNMLNLMRSKFTNIAVVVDEYGNHIGIVTLEDILEKLLGEILDESDSGEDEEFEVKEVSEGEYIVSAWAPIEQLVSEIGLEIEESVYRSMDVRTVAGFLMYLTGDMLRYGDVYEYGNFVFKVVGMENNRVSKILVKRK